jgi:hypothetical protein
VFHRARLTRAGAALAGELGSGIPQWGDDRQAGPG